MLKTPQHETISDKSNHPPHDSPTASSTSAVADSCDSIGAQSW